MNSSLILREKLNIAAGKDLYSSGILDRNELARLIFNNSSLLRKVNDIVHPIVFDEFKKWASEAAAPYVIMEAAILFESKGFLLVDKVLSVTAPIEERIARVMGRSDLTRNQVLERVNSQMDDDERNRQSDYIINNSDSDLIIPEVLKIHEEMLRMVTKEK